MPIIGLYWGVEEPSGATPGWLPGPGLDISEFADEHITPFGIIGFWKGGVPEGESMNCGNPLPGLIGRML